MIRCLFCYRPLVAAAAAAEYHPACSRQLFGRAVPPVFPYSEAQLLALAEDSVRQHITVPGVQPKLSLGLVPATAGAPARLTIVGALGGDYILKPPTARYPSLPEVEDLTMHLATLARLPTVPHGLLRLQNGALAYVTRRIDRVAGGKRHMEDLCQLTERLTENKYDGSHEQIAKALLRYSANPGLDVVNYYELVLFCLLTGNADMHLKNFSLLHTPGLGYNLAPAYDLVATALVNPADPEELALTLNGKKRRLRPDDFWQAARQAGVGETVLTTMFARFARVRPAWHQLVAQSFLPAELQATFHALLDQRFEQMGIAR